MDDTIQVSEDTIQISPTNHHADFFKTSCFSVLNNDNFEYLTTASLKQLVDDYESEFFSGCPAEFAKSLANALAKKRDSDTAAELQAALFGYPLPVVQEIAHYFGNGSIPATTHGICEFGNDTMYRADQAVKHAKALLAVWTTHDTSDIST